jgi:hypothetical protein
VAGAEVNAFLKLSRLKSRIMLNLSAPVPSIAKRPTIVPTVVKQHLGQITFEAAMVSIAVSSSPLGTGHQGSGKSHSDY